MKRFIKSSNMSNFSESFDLSSLFAVVPSVDHITIQNSNGSIYDGTCGDFVESNGGSLVTDPEGYDFEVDYLLECNVSLVRPYRDCLVVGIEC